MTPEPFTDNVHIEASVATVWAVLTDTRHMPAWMGEPEMRITVETDWRVGEPILIRGFHHVPFENRGFVQACEPHRLLGYRYFSSLSRLADEPDSYTHLRFALAETADGTCLTLDAHGFPTPAIFHHTAFYWAGTLRVLKEYAERLARG